MLISVCKRMSLHGSCSLLGSVPVSVPLVELVEVRVAAVAVKDVSHTWGAVTVSADGMTDAHTSARVLVGQSRPNLCVDSRGWSSRGALCRGSRVSGST